ncbi:MAG: amidohydrolase family protein [Ferruginibacter sp.]
MKHFLTILLLAQLVQPNSYAQVVLDNIAITGVTIIDANHRTPLTDQTVLISKDIIVDIIRDNEKKIPDSFHIIHMKGKYLLPGLIDSHVHMATDPSGTDNREHTLDVLQKMLFTGITSVRDMAGDARTLASLSRDAATGDIKSPNIYYSALMAGPKLFDDPRIAASSVTGVVGKMPYMLSVTDSTNMVLAVAEAKGTGAVGIKLYAYLSVTLVNKIMEEARRQKMLVWSHAWLNGTRPSDLVKANLGSISHAPLMIREKMDSIPTSWRNKPHSDKFWDDSLPDLSSLFQLMKTHNTIFDATLLTYKQWGVEDTSMQYNYEIGKRITSKAYKAGVKICAGTDDDQAEFVQKEMEILVTDAGLTPFDAIIAATLNGAELLHIDDKYGTITVGKVADLFVLDKNPLENIGNIKSVSFVVKKGKIFKK